jgi:tRNA(Ile)-lysidine synthase
LRDSVPDKPVSDAEAAALFGALEHAPALILAVSGGPDSTALLWLAARWRAQLKKPPKLVAVTVDHGLRKESAGEARAVAKLAKNLKVQHRTLRWTGRKPKTGIQEAGREARYRLLGAAAKKAGARYVLAAHTLDDQAETVLFRLARGSGVAGLRGMTWLSSLPASSDREVMLARPLLTIPKLRLIATLAVAKIPFADDPSNRDPRFTRPRLRELMAALAAEGLDARRLVGFARRIARTDDAIEWAVDQAMSLTTPRIAHGVTIRRLQYRHLPAELGLRLLGRVINRLGSEGPVELRKLEALHTALDAALARESEPFRRTLAGAVVTLSHSGVTIELAPPRRNAKKASKSRCKARFTTGG